MTSDPQVPHEEPDSPPVKAPPPAAPIPFTRTAAAWWAIAAGSLTLIVLLIFIAQNLDTTPIHFLGWRWNAPVGIAFLVAAISGALITVMTGAARMVQLRRVARKHHRPNPP